MRRAGSFLARLGWCAAMDRRTTLGLAVAALALGALWNPVAPVAVAVAGAALAALAAGRDRFLVGASLTAWGVRVVLTVILYILSVHPPGVVANLLTPPQDGYRFWIFAFDSRSYHAAGVNLVAAWRYGTEFPAATGPEYFVFTGLLYLVFGAHPLNVALCNALFGALTVTAAYRVAGRVVSPAGARATAAAVALWPSSIIWATQLLKDTICLWLTMAIIDLTLRVVDVRPEAGKPGRSRVLGRAGFFALIFVGSLVMSRFRHHVFIVFIPATAVLAIAVLLLRGRYALQRCLAAGIVILLMVAAVFVGRRIDLEALFGLTNPTAGHVNRGVAYQLAGELDRAESEYLQALATRPGYPPALRNLASTALTRGDQETARNLLTEYVERVPEDQEVQSLLARRPIAPLPPRKAEVVSQGFRITGPESDAAAGRRTIPTDDVVMAIIQARRAYTATGGYSMIDPDVQFTGLGDLILYLPRAVANLLLVPYPSQWFDVKGGTGPFKGLAALEAVLLYLLLPPLLLGTVCVLQSRSVGGVYVVSFGVLIGLLLALVVTNLGTLFRLRLEFLVPFFVMLGPGLRRMVPARWWPQQLAGDAGATVG
ncbi:MAG: tetratricopeptide repeat protein [Candidatus Rokubacteria bacterium]|nr:tetratricopeptide repeat protein [Candidatus Rokubacteria bacterium]